MASALADRLEWLRPGTKHVLFATTGTPATDVDPIRRLTTVDDVCVVAAESAQVSTAEDLRALLPHLTDAVDALGALRPLDATFSVTVTAAAHAGGYLGDITAIVTSTVQAQFGWQPREASRAPVDVRVFLDGAAAVVGVRLLDRPLSDRDYRTVHRPGALRPTVAAAMIRLARPEPDAERLEANPGGRSRCGIRSAVSGTILAEATGPGTACPDPTSTRPRSKPRRRTWPPLGWTHRTWRSPTPPVRVRGTVTKRPTPWSPISPGESRSPSAPRPRCTARWAWA